MLLPPRHFFPAEMHKSFKRRKVFGVLLFGSYPQVDFHPGRISFTTGERTFHWISHFMALAITGALHHHEVGVIVLLERLIVLEHRRSSPSREVKPCLRVQWIAIAGITVFINSCGNASILERLLGAKTVKDNPILINSFDKLGHYLARVCDFVHVYINVPLYWIQPLACVIEMIPWRLVSHTSDEGSAPAFQTKFAAVVRIFCRFEDTATLIFFRGSELQLLRGARHRQSANDQTQRKNTHDPY